MNCSRILHIRFLLALAFAALMASSVPAQNQANPGAAAGSGTANNEVLKLLKSGMPESIVLEKIHALPGKFDISSDALIKLKTAGATEAELKAILGKGLSASETGAVTSEPVKARSVKSARANKAPHIVIEPKIVPVSTAAAKPAPTLLTVDVPLFDEKNLIGSVTGGSGMVRLTADGHTAFGVLNLAGGTNGLYRITDKG